MSDFHVSFVATLLHAASAHTPPGGTQPAHVQFTALPLATRTLAMIAAALDGPAASCTESWTDSQGKACNTIEASSDTPMSHSTRPLAHDETAQCLPFNWPLAVPPLVEPFPELLQEHAAADSKNAPRPTCLDALLDSTDTKHTCLATAAVAKDLEPNRTAFGSGTSDMAVAVLKDECSLKVRGQSLQRTTTTALTDLLYGGTPLKGADLPAGGVPQVLAQGVPDPSVAKESQSCLDRLTHWHMPTKLGLVRRDTTAVDPERLVSQMLDLAVTELADISRVDLATETLEAGAGRTSCLDKPQSTFDKCDVLEVPVDVGAPSDRFEDPCQWQCDRSQSRSCRVAGRAPVQLNATESRVAYPTTNGDTTATNGYFPPLLQFGALVVLLWLVALRRAAARHLKRQQTHAPRDSTPCAAASGTRGI